MNSRKILDKEVNKTEIIHNKSLITKKLLEKERNKIIGTNSLIFNKNNISSISKESSKNKNKEKKDSIDIEIKKDVNIFNNTEVKFVVNKEHKNKIIKDNIFIENDSNKIWIIEYIKKNVINKEINQELAMNIPNDNIISNNIITQQLQI